MAVALSDIRDVILRDGSTLRLRAPAAADADDLLAFFGRLSVGSLYRRFHGYPNLTAETIEPFVAPDWDTRGSLIGTLSERIVAHAGYVRLRDPKCAEVAFAVADQLQGHGVGTRLLEQLAESAAAAGISTFVAEVIPDNAAMLRVFADAGFAVSRRLEGGTTEVRLEIEPTADYRAAVDERDHVAVAASLRPFFAPRAVAVVGASTRRGSIGGELFRNILEAGFDGVAYPVNPKAPSVAGVQAYASIADIPGDVDLAVFCVPGEAVLAEAEAALSKGTRALCVISAGFAETGAEGRRSAGGADRARPRARRAAGRPELPGHLRRRPWAERDVRAARVSRREISASPRRAARSASRCSSRRRARARTLVSFVSIGNKADVSSNDLLEYWEDDDATELILLYLESFGNPRKFARVAGRVARKKPILAMKGGRTAPASARRARTRRRSQGRTSQSTRCSARQASSAPTRSRS